MNPYNLPKIPMQDDNLELEDMEQQVDQNFAMEQEPENILETPGTSYEDKLAAMQRIKDRYLKPRE
jgi:hypothetical protein